MSDRRVERRDFMAGTGMMTDPDRLRELEERQHHSDLNARLPPKTKFSQVMSAPPQVESTARKKKRPVSNEKLRPTANHPAQRATGFFSAEDAELAELLGEDKQKIVMKV